jgi:iron complex outermembrane receptor protein
MKRSPLLALLVLCVAAPLIAQPVAEPSATPPIATKPAPVSSATADGVVALTPFTVTSDDDNGYLATNTLAGSRLNSSLKDTPGVLDVLTKDFLDDIGATTLQEALAFSTNFAEDSGDFDSQGVINTVFPGSQAGVTFRTRGLSGSIARNYLQTDSRPAFYTVERIDNSSGPNSILFGLGSAGGVVNITTKRANLSRNALGLDFRFDSNHSRTVSLDVNQVIIPKTLAIRVNAIAERTQRDRANFRNNTDGAQLAATWRATATTEVRVEYERENTSGSVAYPGPHVVNPYVTNWLDRGAPTYDLPANWTTLTAAQRNAIVNPTGSATAFNYYGAGVSPVVVQNADRAYIINAATSLFTNSSLGSNDANNRQSIDPRFFNPRGNINGPGGQKGLTRDIVSAFVDQKVTDNLYLNLSASSEKSAADTYQAYANGAASGATILADGNGTLTNGTQVLSLNGPALTTNSAGQVVNPYAGQYYTQSRWLHRTQENGRKVIQGTAAGQFNLGKWFGSHRLVGTVSYMETSAGTENFRDSWLYAPFNADPVNTNNGVFRRHYASPLDADNFYVPDFRQYPSLTWNHPTLGPISSGWVTEGENLRTAHQFSYLAAAQSRFINNRLVVTAGYRVDEITDYVFGQTRVKPAGWTASNGLLALDRTNVAKTKTSGPTHSYGAVFHITPWMSVYGNKSSNFGPPRGNIVGPDALTPPITAGKGLDAGLKFTLLEGKVSLDLGYFDTSSNDVTEVLTLNVNTIDSIRGAYNAVFPILNAPVGSAQLFNTSDPAAAAALKAAYPLLRPVYNANADLLDQASRGYELRLTANPIKGVRLRATVSKTEREREGLYKFTLPIAAQLRTYIADLQKKNPGVDVGNLTGTANPGVTIARLVDALDQRLDQSIDSLSNNFGGGKYSANLTTTYDFPGVLKGFGTTLSTRYTSGAYTGAYEVRTGGVSTGALVETVPVFGNSTITYDAALRYRTRLAWLRKTSVSFQLNVANLFDQSAPTIRRVSTIVIAPGAAAPTSFSPSSYFIRTPRTISLTTKLDF